MKTLPAKMRALMVSLAVLVSGQSLAAPAAFTETNVNVQFGYQFLPSTNFVGGAAFEYAFTGPLGLDLSVEPRARFGLSGNFEVGVLAKAMLFPALAGDPPIALAFAIDARYLRFDLTEGLRFGIGPIVSLDLSPFIFSFSALPSLGAGGWSVDLGFGARYYFDPLALDLEMNYGPLGQMTVALGLRYLF